MIIAAPSSALMQKELICVQCVGTTQKVHVSDREIEKFIIRQPPMGEKDDYDGENSWISDGLPSSIRLYVPEVGPPK